MSTLLLLLCFRDQRCTRGYSSTWFSLVCNSRSYWIKIVRQKCGKRGNVTLGQLGNALFAFHAIFALQYSTCLLLQSMDRRVADRR